MNRYRALNDYLKDRFGKKVYKLALDVGGTCPNRDGTKGTGGCLFCSLGGSGEFAEKGTDVREQIRRAKTRLHNKVPADGGYIAYFQSFTNTYAPLAVLRERFFAALEDPDVVALSVATRPDCLPEDVIALLKELNAVKPVWVELGLQTSKPETAKLINRCYENDDYTQAVGRLNEAGIEVITHVILGLPGETAEDMKATVRFACAPGIQGIKLQLLHVLSGARLAELPYEPMTKERYFEALSACLEEIPPKVVIHRLTGDGDKRLLLAPLWSADKHRVLNDLHAYLEKNDIIQGRKYHG